MVDTPVVGLESSPRWVAREKGFELISEDNDGTNWNYEYKHPTTGIGLLITARRGAMAYSLEFDWSIHEPQTEAIIAAEWGVSDGKSFLRKLIQVLVDSDLPDYPYDDDSEDESLKGKCKSCKQVRILDSNGFCYSC